MLRFEDLRVRDNQDLDRDFFNRRYRLIAESLAELNTQLAQIGTATDNLVTLGLTRVNEVLGPALATASAAAENGFLVATSVTPLTLSVGLETTFEIDDTPARALFAPTPYVVISRGGTDSLNDWAVFRVATTFYVQVEVDCGELRTGVLPASDDLLEIGRVLNDADHVVFDGVMTHAGHSYNCRSRTEVEAVAEAERQAVVLAAERLAAIGIASPTVSIGSTPTGLYANGLDGVTEVRAGVYMFGDMFQAQIGSCAPSDLAVSVLTDVSSHRPDLGHFTVDAGGLALSKDRSTERVANDIGFGIAASEDGAILAPQLTVDRVYQEHGLIQLRGAHSLEDFPIQTKLRIYPNHVCMTAAMYDRYYVVDSSSGDGTSVIAEWSRVNGW